MAGAAGDDADTFDRPAFAAGLLDSSSSMGRGSVPALRPEPPGPDWASSWWVASSAWFVRSATGRAFSARLSSAAEPRFLVAPPAQHVTQEG